MQSLFVDRNAACAAFAPERPAGRLPRQGLIGPAPALTKAPGFGAAESRTLGLAAACADRGPYGGAWLFYPLSPFDRGRAGQGLIVMVVVQSATVQLERSPAVLNGLTLRQRQVMDLVLAGHPSKNIAADLGISRRTVENHRAAIMRRTGATSLPALARIALGAAGGTDSRQRLIPHVRP